MMTLRHLRRPGAARLVSVLLVYFIALRALIPADFMLDRDTKTGAFVITICSGYEAAHALFSPEMGDLMDGAGAAGQAPGGQTHDGHASASHTVTCPFALAALPVLPVSGIDLPAPPVPGRALHTTEQLAAILPTSIRPPLPARGPPAAA